MAANGMGLALSAAAALIMTLGCAGKSERDGAQAPGQSNGTAGAQAQPGPPDGSAGAPSVVVESEPIRRTVALNELRACWLDGGKVKCEPRLVSMDPTAPPDPGGYVGAEELKGLSNLVDISIGEDIAESSGGGRIFGLGCVVSGEGKLWCWGQDWFGDDAWHQPRLVAGLSGVLQVSVGFTHACALLEDGSVWCWGAYVSSLDPPLPLQQVAELPKARQVVSGYGASCAVLQDGGVRCWGPRADTVPAGLSDVREVVFDRDEASMSAFACALRRTGGAHCWGQGVNLLFHTGEVDYPDAQQLAISHDQNHFRKVRIVQVTRAGEAFPVYDFYNEDLSGPALARGVTEMQGSSGIVARTADGVVTL